jgi:hypothetical protein
MELDRASTRPATGRPLSRACAIGLACAALAAAGGCDRSPEANGGPRIHRLHADRPPYPPVTGLPASARGVTTSAEQFVVVGGDEIVRLGTRGAADTTDVSLDELLRALWRLRGDSLGGRGAASPSAAPLLIAPASVPAVRVLEVVAALWQHGARLAVGPGVPGAAREHPVRLIAAQQQARPPAGGATIQIGPRGMSLEMPGAEPTSFEVCGASPDTACLARALDTAAEGGARTVFLRRAE